MTYFSYKDTTLDYQIATVHDNDLGNFPLLSFVALSWDKREKNRQELWP